MRHDILKNVKRLVIKIGSRILTSGENGLNLEMVGRIATQVAWLRSRGYDVIIVSSGAVAAGRSALGLFERPKTIPQKQAAAAVGQTRLMRAYEEAFASFGATVGQVLLTGEDMGDRQRFLNARATIDTLLSFCIIPIINENDTVAVEEIKFGDNDNLSALVTTLAEAQLLLILTDIDGFYSADPRTDPSATLLPLVKAITKEVEQAAGGSGSSVGTGGMATKLVAAKKVVKSGVPTLMVNGGKPDIIIRAMAGDEVGTLFLPSGKGINRRKHWIAYTLRPRGKVIVDQGAREVLSRQGKSLLPSGIVRTEGEFERGSSVRVCGPDGTEFARGLTDYSHVEIEKILGHRSNEIEQILGYRYGDEIIHRDNLVLL